MHKNKKQYIRLLLVLIALAPALTIHADGSKDLYPSGKTGRRAFLRSSSTATVNWPFANQGTHYVYAKAGETITLASSAQGGGGARIRMYDVSGTRVVNSTSGGVIPNRAAELAGPQRQGQTGGNRYTPIYYNVTTTGIYRVEFYARATSDPSTSVNANSDWTQPDNNAGIAAWDVSVINDTNTGFISGRVYTNVLNLSMGTSSPNSTGFYGLIYVRTYDGYTYRVDNNGNNGMYFTFFVNNNGFVDQINQEPIYKSLNFSQPNQLVGRVHNPNNADAGTHITHKLFYTLPANDLPEAASVAVTSNGGDNWSAGNTWLKKPPLTPTISNVLLKGADGIDNQMSQKGGYIEFEANVEGNFKLQVIDGDDGTPIRTITGHAFGGKNEVYWDGKNDDGILLPAGVAELNVSVQLQGAEVHFPFFDMEYNQSGTIIELLDKDNLNNVVSDIVYWDDTDVRRVTGSSNGSNPDPVNNSHLPPTNSTGLSSNVNGHIWGVGGSGTSGQFGDEKSIDTWAFITGPVEDEDFTTSVKVADLKITEVSSDKEQVRAGSTLTYTIKVKNGEAGDGNSDVTGAPFSFILPPGFEDADFDPVTGIDYEFTGGNCGTESTAITYDPVTRTYSSLLDLPNGCEVTYRFTARVTDVVDPANTGVIATILRPNDVTDPNATNTSNAGNQLVPDPDNPFAYEDDLDAYYFPPRDPFFECQYNGGADCNNIMEKGVVILESNYWHGTVNNEWANANNWTGNWVPEAGEDVEFATEVNNPTVGGNNSTGPAKRDLYLDSTDQPLTPGGANSGGRIIGDLINDSDMDLVITTGNQLIINGEVRDGNADAGTIVVKSVSMNPDPVTGVFPNEPTGTLIINPAENPGGVEALVEFYNKAYDCEDCGFYTRSWQYFGIPVNNASFPYNDVTGSETVNLWAEPYNGDKWRPVSTGTALEAFKGYQITNDEKEEPTGVYSFAGTLNTSNASVPLTRTANVNYPGANLVGNSYTAAIPITEDAFTFPAGVQQTVYLFNTGTRDQWRKLNGTAINQEGYRSGQYLAVPVNLGGTLHFPDRIPSMHAFMVVAEDNSGGNLGIDYTRLVKNSEVALGDGSTQIVTRSAGADGNSNAGSGASVPATPFLVMDVMGEESADRVWLFAKEGTTHGFDNGWDGRKMVEGGIAQLYVAGTDESQLQVATVPSMDNVALGFVADTDGNYTLEFSLSEQVKNAGVFLHDKMTGKSVKLSDGASYTFEAKKGEDVSRFRLSQSGEFETVGDEARVLVGATGNGKVVITNRGGNEVTTFISTIQGALLHQVQVGANSETVLENIPAGMYVVHLQNEAISDVRRLIVK